MTQTDQRRLRYELIDPGYELFILGLSIVSLINVAIFILPFHEDVKTVAAIIDVPLCAVLLGDFAWRVRRSNPRSDYLVKRHGWLDFIGSLPFPLLRLFRIVRVGRSLQVIRQLGGRRLVRSIVREKAQTALLAVLFLVTVVLELGSILVVYAERGAPNANIVTGGDALWWAIVSVTTVGYGDKFPVTAFGRIVGVVILVVGVGLFGVFTGYLARYFLDTTETDGQWRSELDEVRRRRLGPTVVDGDPEQPSQTSIAGPAAMAVPDQAIRPEGD